MATPLRLAVLLQAASLLAACGFQLAGRQALPERLAVVNVEVPDDRTEFVLGLRRALVNSGAWLVPQSGEARAIVQVLGEEVGERILSVSSRNVPR